MLESWIERFVDYQIGQEIINEEERNIYKYGYQVLVEYCFNTIAAILIAVFFHAYEIVIIFTVSFMLVRSYAGGYHAKTSIGCFALSAIMLICVILVEKMILNIGVTKELLFMEIIFFPYIFKRVPIPIINRPLSENEKKHFGMRARQWYVAEVVVAIVLAFIGREQSVLAILASHFVIFLLALIDGIGKLLQGRKSKKIV